MITSADSLNTSGVSLIDTLIGQQQRLTAVERFAQFHADATRHAAEETYRNLIPLSQPQPGEQFAFEVDLDSCSGCKSCVAACHNLNGLEDEELWRSVGLLHGGSVNQPAIQHVTTACHHCVEPGCLHGCPVEAYEKDPLTGIVRHLDDQCIGCQYCIFMCPYDVPAYSKSKGIVRKCDMCHDRLSAGEAPACVQSCPNQAIRITIVNKQTVIEDSEANVFLPGAPEPSQTVPATVYKSKKALPRNLLPADHFSNRSQHCHMPLVVMLVLTQMSVGAFVIEQLLSWVFGLDHSGALGGVRSAHLVGALLLGFTGLAASVFHLGRPQYAYRALIGLKRSWLSREILAFGLFAGAATIYAGMACLPLLGIDAPRSIENTVGAVAVSTGLGGVFCSIMVYVVTRRPMWNLPRTAIRFFSTALVLGIPVALLISLIATLLSAELTVVQVMNKYGTALCRLVIVVALAKLVFEFVIFVHLRDRQHTPLKRTAMLMAGDLSLTTLKRFFFGLVGGVVIPSLLLAEPMISPTGFHPLFITVAVGMMFVALLIGELHERFLFFTAVAAPKMPGAV